jgi:CspA family cold shock protein
METGKVVWFDEARGFGFIRPNSGKPNVFVHITAVQKSDMQTLTESQDISFGFGEHNGRRAAVNIQKVGWS